MIHCPFIKMDRLDLGETPKTSKLENFSKPELIQKYSVLENELARLIRENYELRDLKISNEQLQLVMAEQLESLQAKIFGRSSERYKKPIKDDDDDSPNAPPKLRVKKPSERYPNIPVREQVIAIEPPPNCPCCNKVMTDSGMTEDSEQLTVIPKKYEVLLQMRVKYRCQCQSSILTAPLPSRIIEGSTYSDEMIKDVSLSKYCDLIPIERYVAMAKRADLADLPPHSLIELTHQFADFVSGAYVLIKNGILAARVLHADETPHRMLEGDDKKTWYLWGFSTADLCYLECHNTRSGSVASDILLNSECQVLLTDVYSGYGKAIRETNQERLIAGKSLITCAHCNAHSRRYFFKVWPKYKEAEFYLDHYHEMYRLNKATKGQSPPIILELRQQMRPRFEAMKKRALEELASYPRNGKYGKALRYFLNNYDQFILFLDDPQVPIDNNAQEKNFRSHVVGRKTWYGTHSKRGALTAAILFTLVETCKRNQVNPREYFDNLVDDLLAGANPYTPKDFKSRT